MNLNSGKDDSANIGLLWTGGWDSTYRLVELSRMKYTVQPFYVCGDGRKSEKYEIKAMKKIISKLKNREETKANILPIEFIDKKTIPIHKEITDAYNQIYKEVRLGSQHEWLARLAFKYPGMELGTEAAPLEVSNILTVINKFGKLLKDDNGEGYLLDPENSTKEVLLVLGNFKFPIINKTGEDMKSNIQLWGYEEIMKEVWVCHNPIFGKSCGLCHPCELKIETGMEFLLDRPAKSRYTNRNNQPNKLLYLLERKISRVLERVLPNTF